MPIDLKEALQIIESGEWFSCRFITADVAKGTGGKIIEIPKARISRKTSHSPASSSAPAAQLPPSRKAPRHHYNMTRNIELPNHQLRKLHPILITHINNHPVL